MVENRNGKKVLITPVTAEDLADIHIGDIVYLDGDLVTCRDVAHRRLIEGKRELPVDLHGKAILHAGPIVRPSETAASGYEMVSVGPTTSMRMEKFEKEFVEQTGVKVIVGKGAWVRTPNTPARPSRPSIASSLPAAQSSRPQRSSGSPRTTGTSSACPRRCGAAT